MSEEMKETQEPQEFNPMDLNQDGKVSVKERLQYAADKANEAISIAADVIKDEAKEAYERVKEYQALSPEEKKARQDEWKEKATEMAGKAADAAKGFAGEVKENAEKILKK